MRNYQVIFPSIASDCCGKQNKQVIVAHLYSLLLISIFHVTSFILEQYLCLACDSLQTCSSLQLNRCTDFRDDFCGLHLCLDLFYLNYIDVYLFFAARCKQIIGWTLFTKQIYSQ